MALTLSHYSIRTANLAACRAFYVDVLGLSVGPRPPFPFPGIWLYSGEQGDYANAVVHVIAIDEENSGGLSAYLGDRDVELPHGTGSIDHIAFFASGLSNMLAHLKGLGITPRERTVPALGLHQVFLNDPDGVVIELNYPAAERSAMAG
ncbi:VOC family protein [Noviherbaspirillum pedocola]|uniref:VOC family protein n=1 Tax=Noviherbaspirillum pedocola TaxID=2801341 RepID=A0A934SV26_9BURK|nr:VOC family protein [Noviherbaspirillum pedocola]MBK4733337.1 VOC family protein [Noviherbaspirillum pedocola]